MQSRTRVQYFGRPADHETRNLHPLLHPPALPPAVCKSNSEVLGAPRRLIVCGAGHDAAPVVRYGAELGYSVTVVDDRRPFLSEERFPRADQLLQASPAELAQAIELSPTASVVIMSHNYLRDLDYLGSVIGHRVAYIGVLGPGERLARLLDDLADRGQVPDEHDLAVLAPDLEMADPDPLVQQGRQLIGRAAP